MADLPTGRQAQRIIMFYVYVIVSISRSYIYVGMTNNPDRRIAEHNTGKERTTKPYAPFKNLLIESFSSRIDARKREKYLKSGIGKEWLKQQID
jgi:putative endonuclease